MTVRDVEEASGLSFQYVSSLENGGGNPTMGALEAVAKALRADVSVEIMATEDATRWTCATATLTNEQRARLIQFAELLPRLSAELVDGLILGASARASDR